MSTRQIMIGMDLKRPYFTIPIAILLSLLAIGHLQPSYAKPPIKKLTYTRPAEPRYDSYSSAPGHFEFTVKKTELLPSAEEILLKGGSDKKLIRPPEPRLGAIAKNGAPLTGSASKRNPLSAAASGTPLYGTTTGGDRRPLQGTVNSTTLKADTRQKLRDSSLSTVEHGLRPRFYVDFAKMTPKFAPKLSRLIDAELENARLTVPGDVARTEKLMNQELRARPPQPDVGSIPATINIARLPAKSLQSELQKSKQQQKQIAETAAREEDEIRRNAGKNAPGKMPGGPGKGAPPLVIPFPDQKGVPRLSMPSISKQNISAAERAMNQELANIRPPSKAELAAQLAAAGTQAKLATAKAQPAMDLVLTSLRQPKSIKMPVAGEDAQKPELDSFATIQWDQWHAKFAEASRDPILQSLKKCGNPSGENTVEITVSSDGRITVNLNQASKNATFDKAVLQAYRSMEKHPALKYPPGSRRSMLTFLIDVKHVGEGAPSSVKSQTSVGDTETVRKKR